MENKNMVRKLAIFSLAIALIFISFVALIPLKTASAETIYSHDANFHDGTQASNSIAFTTQVGDTIIIASANYGVDSSERGTPFFSESEGNFLTESCASNINWTKYEDCFWYGTANSATTDTITVEYITDPFQWNLVGFDVSALPITDVNISFGADSNNKCSCYVGSSLYGSPMVNLGLFNLELTITAPNVAGAWQQTPGFTQFYSPFNGTLVSYGLDLSGISKLPVNYAGTFATYWQEAGITFDGGAQITTTSTSTISVYAWNVPNGNGLAAGFVFMAFTLIPAFMIVGWSLKAKNKETYLLWLLLGLTISAAIGALVMNGSSVIGGNIAIALVAVFAAIFIVYIWRGKSRNVQIQ
jgi:hypothetical protein